MSNILELEPDSAHVVVASKALRVSGDIRVKSNPGVEGKQGVWYSNQVLFAPIFIIFNSHEEEAYHSMGQKELQSVYSINFLGGKKS